MRVLFPRLAGCAWVGLLLLLGCAEPPETVARIRPEVAEPAARTAGSPEAEALPARDTAVAAVEPGASPSDSAGVPAASLAAWLGRWESATRDGYCIELRDDGRFELAYRRRGRGDIVVRGRLTSEAGADDALRVTLMARSIRQERYVTACRRHVYPEQALGHLDVLGRRLRTGGDLDVVLRRTDGAPTLCVGDRCQRLRRRAT